MILDTWEVGDILEWMNVTQILPTKFKFEPLNMQRYLLPIPHKVPLGR